MRRTRWPLAVLTTLLLRSLGDLNGQCDYNCWCDVSQTAYSGTCLGGSAQCVNTTEFCYCADGVSYRFTGSCDSPTAYCEWEQYSCQ